MKLWKTTIIIWSDQHPGDKELTDMAHAATSGDAYCSKQTVVEVEQPTLDDDWDHNEFFGAACGTCGGNGDVEERPGGHHEDCPDCDGSGLEAP